MRSSPGLKPRSPRIKRLEEERDVWSRIVQRLEERRDANAPRLYEGLHDRQLQFLNDPARRKLAVCSRRAGKTFALKCALVESARSRPRAMALYITITRLQAKRLIWHELKSFLHVKKIEYRSNESELTITLQESGGQIFLAGADDSASIEKFRGLALDLVVLDEAGSFGAHFRALIDDVLSPALEDYAGGIVLIGTPNAACAGYFHDAATGILPGWSRHEWTVLDNSMYPRWRDKETGQPLPNWRELADAFRREYIQERGWTEDHPSYIREILGRWARDLSGLVYRFLEGRNEYTALPAKVREWKHIMGVDLGRVDAFALVVWAFSPELPDLYEVDSYQKPGLTISQWAEAIRGRIDRWHPIRSVADCGALGGSIVEDMNSRHALNLIAAEKKDKLSGIELWNSDAEKGWIHLRKGGQYASQARILQWDPDRPHEKEDERFANDLCDSGLYGYREAWHWTYRKPKDRPRPGSREHWEEEERKMEEEADAEAEAAEEAYW